MLRLPIITVLFIMFTHQSIPPASGGRAFANSRAIPELLTRSRSHQNITTKKVLLEKKADWLVCKGQE